MKMLPCIWYVLVLYLGAIWTWDGYVSAETKLCTWCRCVRDKSTWMEEMRSWDDSTMSYKPDPNALLLNCSGLHASPFAGAYEWPDIPLLKNRDGDSHGSKANTTTATRADFSSCEISGGLRSLPSIETRKLRELSLAHNSLTWILPSSLAMPALRYLDLSHNKLATVSADSLPLSSDPSTVSNLEVVRLSHNEIHTVPWEAMLRMPKLEDLDLSDNFIYSIENGFAGRESELVFKSIKVLNLRRNRLTDLSVKVATRFPGLVELDISMNSIEVVPEAFLTEMNATFRNLSKLNLDGNPIKLLGPNSFVGSPAVRHLSVSNTATLSEISSEAFDGLPELKTLKLRRNIVLSRLPKKGFLWAAFLNGSFAVEEVDLSYNSLEYISEKFLPWKEIKRVNLQGNPWNCNCSLQWMLDLFLPNAYQSDSSILFDLRCYRPKWLQGRRFVHWLGRSNGVYCGNMMEKLRMHINGADVEDVDVVAMGMSTGMITVLATITVVVVGLLVVSVVLQRRANKMEKQLRTSSYQCRNPRVY